MMDEEGACLELLTELFAISKQKYGPDISPTAHFGS
jgi:hypothetical protein